MSEFTLTEKPFYMVRHGETCHNAAGLVTGDYQLLTAKGIEQAKALSPVFEKLPGNTEQYYLVSSDLQRAKDTLTYMAGRKPDHSDKRLNERNNGFLSGSITTKWFYQQNTKTDEFAQTWRRQPDNKFIAQVLEGVNDNVQKCPEGKTTIMVAHKGAIARVAEAAGYSRDTNFENAGMFYFVPDPITHKWTIYNVSLQNGLLVEEPLSRKIISPYSHEQTHSTGARI